MGCAFGELSNIYKIPAMVISHGSHVYHEEPEANFEWEVFSKAMINKIFPYIAAQNLHMLNFLEKSGYSKDQIVNTGPLIYKKFDTSKERINNYIQYYVLIVDFLQLNSEKRWHLKTVQDWHLKILKN